MRLWLAVAGVGFVISLVGLSALVLQYRRGNLGLASLLAYGIGYLSLASYALLSAFRPHSVTGPLTLLILAPAFVSVVVLVYQHQRNQ